jgi:short-subunit dehydrogenase
MPDKTSQRLAVITGGSSGIGRSAARLFAEKGWRVALIARGPVPLEDARADIAGRGGSVACYEADVADCAALRAVAGRIAAELGPIDVWVNNAGTSVFGTFQETTEEEFRRVTDVTYMGAVNGTRIALEHMRPRNAGTIVNINSAIGFRGVPMQSAYSGAKWAMRGFSEAVRAELIAERSRVRLSVVYPPSVNTPFYSHAVAHYESGVPRPPPPVYQPEIVADAIYLAATTGRRDVLVGTQTVATAVLNGVSPRLADVLLGAVMPLAQRSTNQGVAARRDISLFTPSTLPAPERGSFDRESLASSEQLWLSKHRGSVGAGLAFGAVLMGMALLAPPRR